MEGKTEWWRACAPTLAVVSVKLFKVVDLPEEGLPTSPMRGSRGIVTVSYTHLTLPTKRIV